MRITSILLQSVEVVSTKAHEIAHIRKVLKTFKPAPRYDFPEQPPPTFYVGHMQKALFQMKHALADTDIVIELRDARLPITSINVMFERLMETGWAKSHQESDRAVKSSRPPLCKRLVVYNKRDLADPRFEQPIVQSVAQTGPDYPDAIFMDARNVSDIKKLLRRLKEMHANGLRASGVSSHEVSDDSQITKCMIIGMPNVGKSTLLNGLRRIGFKPGTKVAATSADPGHTQSLQTLVRIMDQPKMYVIDTPGIMIPQFGNDGHDSYEHAMKLALTASIKTNFVPIQALASYLMHRLNLRDWDVTHGRPTRASKSKNLLINSESVYCRVPPIPVDPPAIITRYRAD